MRFDAPVASKGALSTHPYGGVSPRNYLATQNISLASLNPKISANFKTLTPVNKHKSPRAMQIEARIAATEPRNISWTMFYAQRTMISVGLDPKI